MKKIAIAAIAALCVIAIPFFTKAQVNESKLDMKTFGIGLHMEQFKRSSLYDGYEISPSNNLIFTFNPSHKFRIESEIGFSRISKKDADFKGTGINLGVGSFYMFQKGNVNFYTGARLGTSFLKNEGSFYSDNEDSSSKITQMWIAPTFGVEYFFNPHFSLGGEISLKMLKTKNNNSWRSDTWEEKSGFINTETGLFMRFYF